MTDYYEAAQFGFFKDKEKGFSFGPESDGPDTGDVDWIAMNPPEVANFREGWAKFHLSVHPKDVERAWNIAVDEMLKDPRIFHKARVAAPGTVAGFADNKHPHAGKMITIYTNAVYGDAEGPAANYLNLLQHIEDRLHAANIRPGLHVEGDVEILGSAFISYRGAPAAEDPYEKLLRDAPFEPLRDVAKWEWQKAEGLKGAIMHIDVCDHEGALQTIGSLQRLGIKAEERSLTNPDRLTVRIEGDAMRQVLAEQERLKQTPMVLAAPRPKTPRPGPSG